VFIQKNCLAILARQVLSTWPASSDPIQRSLWHYSDWYWINNLTMLTSFLCSRKRVVLISTRGKNNSC